MSWSKNAFARLIAASGLALWLAACGYQPLYGQNAGGEATQRHLASIHVKTIADRDGQRMRTALKQRLAPRARNLTKVYELNVTLNESVSELAVERNAFATRANLSLTANYSLTNQQREELLNAKVNTVASYNILTSDFATLAAKDDARKRAIEDLADTLRTRLAAYFKAAIVRPQTETPPQ